MNKEACDETTESQWGFSLDVIAIGRFNDLNFYGPSVPKNYKSRYFGMCVDVIN